jgi:hypothetical protein
MFDFFGRVICQKCKSHMMLGTLNTHNGTTQAVFSCSNPACFDESAAEWQSPRQVLFGQQRAA